MELINDEMNPKNKNSKIILISAGAGIGLLILLAIGLIVYLSVLKSGASKYYLDNTQISVAEDFIITQEDQTYVNVKEFATLVGYEYNNGEYNNPYEEDTTKCYVKSANEVTSFISDSNIIYKVVYSEDGDIEYYTLSDKVIMINNQLYATLEAIQIGYNVTIIQTTEQNKIAIYTLDFLEQNYTADVTDAVTGDDCSFSNKKLLRYNMILVENSEKQYGVYTIDGKIVISTKYKNIKFVESTKSFIVTTEDDKQGISKLVYDTDGNIKVEVKISPNYDEIKQLDKDLDLFLVKENEKYGVINGEGKVVIYPEYDQIGIDTSNFVNNDIENQYIFYGKCIPVKRDGKWGVLSNDGKTILALEYQDLGCIEGDSITKKENNIILVPDVEGIVVKKNDCYGVMNSSGKKLVPCALQEIYKVTSSGENIYYMTYNDTKINTLDWIESKQTQTTTTTE